MGFRRRARRSGPNYDIQDGTIATGRPGLSADFGVLGSWVVVLLAQVLVVLH